MTDEQDETGGQPPKRKYRRHRRPKQITRPNATVADYMPKGAPLDEHGNPIPNSEISPDDIDGLAFDAEGARALHEHHEILRRKNRGEDGVRWHGDPPWRFKEVKDWKPHAMVSFMQLSPHKSESIPARPISSFRGYQELVNYLKGFWHGGEASYQWTVYDDQNPTWARSTVYFHSEDSEGLQLEDDEMKQGQPPGWPGYPWPPQFQQPPWPMQPPWGYPAPQVPLPPPMAPQQPPPQAGPTSHQQPAVAAPYPMPAVTDPALLAMMRDMMNTIAQQQAELAQLKGQSAQPQTQYPPPYLWPYLFQQQQPKPEETKSAQPPPPKTAVEQLSDMASAFRQVNQVRAAIVNEVAPGEAAHEDNPIKGDEDFPVKFKQVGPVTYVAGPDGKVSTPLMANIDGARGVLESVFSRVESILDKATSGRAQAHEKDVELMERANKAVQHRLMLDQYERQLMSASRAATPQPTPPTQQQQTAAPSVPEGPSNGAITSVESPASEPQETTSPAEQS